MIIYEDELMHVGTPRHSGRYPYGSGEDPHQHGKDLLASIADLRSKGLSDKEIAKGLGMETTTELRNQNTIAKNAKKQSDIAQAQRLREKGYSHKAIGERMGGIPESSVRALLRPGEQAKLDVLHTTANMLKDQVAKKTFVQVGSGVENQLGISQTKLGTALSILKSQGYEVRNIQTDQLGTGAGKKSLVKVLAPPGTTYRDIVMNKDKIQLITESSTDGGHTYDGIQPPLGFSSKRLGVAWKEDGGSVADGVIYVRPGVPDVDLGKAHYAQVRIAVDGTHYIKGMAMYKNDLPEGQDLVFNTSKPRSSNKLDALKPMQTVSKTSTKIDPDNPFGATIQRQVLEKDGQGKTVRDAKGKPRVTSVMNKVNEEGDWEGWHNSLSSQMLSKQSPVLAEKQLAEKYNSKKADLDEIMSLTNPVVRKKLLEEYADAADSSAIHLKAAALPRQGNHVILPLSMKSWKENEIYAPNYNNGDIVVLIRHPHGGPFEIPELRVNNQHPEAKALLGQAKDAVGIHPKVAQRLSGADFDGDTVLVIPNKNRQIKTAPALAGLNDFDPKTAYPGYEGMPKLTPQNKQAEMGKISNLITDMTIRGASSDEIAAAVRHSMVVIDAEKHNLNYRESAKANGIANLKKNYQIKENGKSGGASTLISRARARIDVPEKKPRAFKNGGPVDKATGKKMYELTGASYVDKKTGKTIFRTTRSRKLVETNDAHTLSSGTPVEKIYADHSIRLKALANTARKEAVNTPPITRSPSAAVAYADQVASLNAKLNIALRNRPLERQAQLFANSSFEAKRASNPDMDSDDVKKLKSQELARARARTGARKQAIEISDHEWAAIQANAISNNKLTEILKNADIDIVRKLATPRTGIVMTSAKKQQAITLLNRGFTQAQVAQHLGVSLSTLKTEINSKEG